MSKHLKTPQMLQTLPIFGTLRGQHGSTMAVPTSAIHHSCIVKDGPKSLVRGQHAWVVESDTPVETTTSIPQILSASFAAI